MSSKNEKSDNLDSSAASAQSSPSTSRRTNSLRQRRKSPVTVQEWVASLPPPHLLQRRTLLVPDESSDGIQDDFEVGGEGQGTAEDHVEDLDLESSEKSERQEEEEEDNNIRIEVPTKIEFPFKRSSTITTSSSAASESFADLSRDDQYEDDDMASKCSEVERIMSGSSLIKSVNEDEMETSCRHQQQGPGYTGVTGLQQQVVTFSEENLNDENTSHNNKVNKTEANNNNEGKEKKTSVDSLYLGAEAESSLQNQRTTKSSASQDQQEPLKPSLKSGMLSPDARRRLLMKSHEQFGSFKSDISFSPSVSSVDSVLYSREVDPSELLMDLGFGGGAPALMDRIPVRFFQPSRAKGISVESFLKKQEEIAEKFDSGFNGYRGLNGSMDSRPSGIVEKIIERIRSQDRRLKRQMSAFSAWSSTASLFMHQQPFSPVMGGLPFQQPPQLPSASLPTVSSPLPTKKFQRSFSVEDEDEDDLLPQQEEDLGEEPQSPETKFVTLVKGAEHQRKSFRRNVLPPLKGAQAFKAVAHSVLSPENREFIQSQQRRRKRSAGGGLASEVRRIVLGGETFQLTDDGLNVIKEEEETEDGEAKSTTSVVKKTSVPKRPSSSRSRRLSTMSTSSSATTSSGYRRSTTSTSSSSRGYLTKQDSSMSMSSVDSEWSDDDDELREMNEILDDYTERTETEQNDFQGRNDENAKKAAAEALKNWKQFHQNKSTENLMANVEGEKAAEKSNGEENENSTKAENVSKAKNEEEETTTPSAASGVVNNNGNGRRKKYHGPFANAAKEIINRRTLSSNNNNNNNINNNKNFNNSNGNNNMANIFAANQMLLRNKSSSTFSLYRLIQQQQQQRNLFRPFHDHLSSYRQYHNLHNDPTATYGNNALAMLANNSNNASKRPSGTSTLLSSNEKYLRQQLTLLAAAQNDPRIPRRFCADAQRRLILTRWKQ